MPNTKLPRVADFLAEQDVELVAEMLAKYPADDDCDVPQDPKKCVPIVKSVIDALSSKDAADTDSVVVGELAIDPGEEPNEFVLHEVATLYRLEDVPKSRAWLDISPAKSTTEMLNAKDLAVPIPYAFEFTPWNEIANYLVYVPEGTCKRSQAELAADIIWETTLTGLTEDVARVRSEAIMKRLTENAEMAKDLIKRAETEGDTDASDDVEFVEMEDLDWDDWDWEWMDAMGNVCTLLQHNLWLRHIANVAKLADMLGL